jgi:uncharacterized lipoprotein YddW (UPF0748 family)
VRMYYFLVIILVCCIPLHASEEKRAVWVVRDALHSRESIDQIISTAVTSKITDLFIQVRALGQTYYPSSIEGQASEIIGAYDPLSLIVEKAHRYNIKVHAWINVFYIWAQDNTPDSTHVFIKQKEYILRNQTFPTYASLKEKRIEGFFLDPASGVVQEHILAIVHELINNYDLDGIHLDYYRYPEIHYSFTPSNRTMFRIRNFFDPLTLYNADHYYERAGFAVFRYADSLYRASLINVLTEFLDRIYDVVKQKSSALEISIAVKPDPIQAKHRYFQDWTD